MNLQTQKKQLSVQPRHIVHFGTQHIYVNMLVQMLYSGYGQTASNGAGLCSMIILCLHVQPHIFPTYTLKTKKRVCKIKYPK